MRFFFDYLGSFLYEVGVGNICLKAFHSKAFTKESISTFNMFNSILTLMLFCFLTLFGFKNDKDIQIINQIYNYNKTVIYLLITFS